MILPLMVRKSLRQHLLSSTVTGLSVALAAGLWLTVWSLQTQMRQTFSSVNAGFDAVLGARGSKLQLILNAIFHLEASPGNMRWSDFEQIQQHPWVELAVPLAVGDNYQGYRLVGTTLEMFHHGRFAPGRKCDLHHGGRFFEENRREAVVGSFVAQRLQLKPGDTFQPAHGFHHNPEVEHEETYLVVGILKPSNTPADRVIWIPLAGLQRMSGHDPQAAQDISAVLIRFKAGNPQAGFQLDHSYNRQGDRLTLAWPINAIVAQLFDKIAWFDRVLALVSSLVALVAIASVLASLYNSMNERRRELAILRALGAHRRTIFSAVVGEALAIVAGGVLLGFVLYAILMSVVAHVIRSQTGVVLDVWQVSAAMLFVPIILAGFGMLAGIVPAIKAYRTSVAEHLAATS